MRQYRIKKVEAANGVTIYYPQFKWLWMWFTCSAGEGYYFLDQAENKIKSKIRTTTYIAIN